MHVGTGRAPKALSGGRGVVGGHEDLVRVSGGSGGAAVLVGEPAACRVTPDRLGLSDRRDVIKVVGRPLVEAAVGSMAVVVLDVFLEKHTQLALVPDDRPVEKLMAQGANPSLGESTGLRCPWRDPRCGDASSAEHGVERAGELPCSVTNEEPESVVVGESHEELARGLGGPWSGRVGGDSGQGHSAGRDFNDQQDVESAEQRGVDTGEVGGDDCVGLRSKNSDHDGPVRSRRGSMPAARRTFHTVDAASS